MENILIVLKVRFRKSLDQSRLVQFWRNLIGEPPLNSFLKSSIWVQFLELVFWKFSESNQLYFLQNKNVS